jgi:hypothetical protein
MTTETPLARYSAVNGALTSGFVTAQLHHPMGHDPDQRLIPGIPAAVAVPQSVLAVRLLASI